MPISAFENESSVVRIDQSANCATLIAISNEFEYVSAC